MPIQVDMAAPVILVLVFVTTFLGLARAALTTPRDTFLGATRAMAVVAGLVLLLAPLAGAVILVPVLGSRMLAQRPVPASVDELLERYRPVS
ncbi:MAG TPA: hypothetical protein VHN98_07845 [Acidimicrobiales bacterium]|nr:hypothetical protein [Acidimicrobiales bacterium]